MVTEERMEKIEGQLTRVRWFNRCLMACIILGLGVGCNYYSHITPSTTVI